MGRKRIGRRTAVTGGIGFCLLAVAAFVLGNRPVPVRKLPILSTPTYSVLAPAANTLFDPARQVWKRGSTERPEVCLTFDDGPHGAATEKILNALKAAKAPATFFVVGMMVEKYPKLARRMIAEGHEVGNHTYEHMRLENQTEASIVQELAACDATVARATGRRMTLMRPPGMRICDSLVAFNRASGTTLVYWTIGAKDFVGHVPNRTVPVELRGMPVATPELVVERVEKQLRNGAIILLHDNDIVAEALPLMIERIRAKGYAIKSCAEMMAALPQSVRIVANPPIRRDVVQR